MQHIETDLADMKVITVMDQRDVGQSARPFRLPVGTAARGQITVHAMGLDERACAAQLDQSHPPGIALTIQLLGGDVLDVDNLLRARDTASDSFRSEDNERSFL